MRFTDNILHYIILSLAVVCTALLLLLDKLKNSGLFGSKLDVVEEAFNGGRPLTRNIVTVALATSCAFSPSILLETVYLTKANVICLIIARGLSVLMCVFLWKKMLTLGLNSMAAFISFRFNNKFALLFYYVNSILGFIYLLYIYNGPLLYSLPEYIKLNRDGFLLFVGFVSLCSFGGMRIALPLCSILTLMELIAGTMLIGSTRGLNDISNTTDARLCHSNNPLHSLATTFPLFLTVQPLYSLYFNSGTQLKGTTAMVAGLGVYILKSVFALVAAERVRRNAMSLNMPIFRMFHVVFPSIKGSDSLNRLREIHPSDQSPSDYINLVSAMGAPGPFLFNCLIYGPLAAYYSLRLCLLVAELSEKFVPRILITSVKLSGDELQRIYFSLYCFMVCIIVVNLLTADRYILMPEYRAITLYVPHMTTVLMQGVTVMIVLGALAPKVRPVHILAAWCITTLLSVAPMCIIFWKTHRDTVSDAINEWEEPSHDKWLCYGMWASFGSLLINGLLAVLLVSVMEGRAVWVSGETDTKPGASSFIYTMRKTTLYKREKDAQEKEEEEEQKESENISSDSASISSDTESLSDELKAEKKVE
ncbi:unnamed protein product [Mesocestoides corti]|uniref:AA_permease domain-containing protein n=1 Tax=Mesocestoides corti TaxID=53468 RepID=A0A0R3U4J4_MESCO|nr:unnamed protein product [Mesocestoides corti]